MKTTIEDLQGRFDDLLDESFISAASNAKYENTVIGGGAAIPVGGKVSFEGVTFVDNKTLQTEKEYNTLSTRQKEKCTIIQDDEKGKVYELDNSYFAVKTTGAASSVSFTSMCSFNKYGAYELPTGEKEKFDAQTEGKTLLSITPGSFDFVAKSLLETLDKGEQFEKVYSYTWESGKHAPWQKKATDRLTYDVRMDVWAKVK